MHWLLWTGLGTILLLLIPALAFTLYQRWERRHTYGMAYFGRPLQERREIKKRIERYSTLILPIAQMIAPKASAKGMPGFEFRGVWGPPEVASASSFSRASVYTPTTEDAFVVTQMKSGTTWMQQLVFEILHRGEGDLSDAGYGHLYSVSPWIEAQNSVTMDDAPLVGEPPTRIIKTHLPAGLCPFNDKANYIYVARHPLSCYASTVDFVTKLMGPFAPDSGELADWFCSEKIWWSPWPDHVSGWWDLAAKHSNVLFTHYESMKKDFDGIMNQVAILLGISLSEAERDKVRHKCSFAYMKEHEESFEMSPPNMYSIQSGRFMHSGSIERHQDVPPEIKAKIAEFCNKRLASHNYPVSEFYPDLVASG